MLPEEYIKETKKADRRKKYYKKIFYSLSFVLCLYIIGPLLHELGHLLVLFLAGCRYSIDLSLSFLGLYGSIQPLCSLNKAVLLGFYSAGYLATILAGGLFSIKSTRMENNWYRGIIGFSGIGILFSTIMSIGTHSDVFLAVETLGVSPFIGWLVTLLLIVGVSATGLRVLERLLR